MKTYSAQEIIALIEKAPPDLQDAVTSFETATTIASIGKARGLHIDAIGRMAELNRNMLLGVISPQEFLQELVATGVKDADAQQIIKEINEKIFTPVHNKMRTQGNVVASASKEFVPQTIAPTAPVAPQLPVPTMSTPLANKVLNRLEVSPENLPGVVLPKPASKPAVPSQLSGALRSAGIQLLSDHEVAHMDLKKPATPAAYPMQPLRPQTPVPPPAPRPIPPPIAPQPMPVKPIAPAPMPSLPNYTIDPYREMPDEHEK